MEEHKIPRYLNALPQVLWWELDEFLIVIAFMMIGILVNKGLIFGIIGVIVTKFYTKVKYRRQEGYMKHLLYMLGFYNAPGRVPEYWVKELLK